MGPYANSVVSLQNYINIYIYEYLHVYIQHIHIEIYVLSVGLLIARREPRASIGALAVTPTIRFRFHPIGSHFRARVSRAGMLAAVLSVTGVRALREELQDKENFATQVRVIYLILNLLNILFIILIYPIKIDTVWFLNKIH